MNQEKKYSPTAYKLSELKKKGVVPFSKVGLKCLNLSALMLSINFIILPSNFNYSFIESFNSEINDVSFLTKEIFLGLKAILLIGGILSLTSIIGRYLQTEILFMPLSQSSKGILKKAKYSSYKYNLTISLLKCITTIGGLFLILIYLHSKIFTNQEPISIKFIQNILNLNSAFLITSAIFFITKAKSDFFEEHKMTKQELIQEMKETEGSQETKKHLRSLN
jgi:flagellar biosynthesis protein FlhB